MINQIICNFPHESWEEAYRQMVEMLEKQSLTYEETQFDPHSFTFVSKTNIHLQIWSYKGDLIRKSFGRVDAVFLDSTKTVSLAWAFLEAISKIPGVSESLQLIPLHQHRLGLEKWLHAQFNEATNCHYLVSRHDLYKPLSKLKRSSDNLREKTQGILLEHAHDMLAELGEFARADDPYLAQLFCETVKDLGNLPFSDYVLIEKREA